MVWTSSITVVRLVGLKSLPEFVVSVPKGTTQCTNQDEICQYSMPWVKSRVPNFHLISEGCGYGSPKIQSLRCVGTCQFCNSSALLMIYGYRLHLIICASYVYP